MSVVGCGGSRDSPDAIAIVGVECRRRGGYRGGSGCGGRGAKGEDVAGVGLVVVVFLVD